MMIEKYNLLMGKSKDQDKTVRNVKTLCTQEGFSLKLVEYHWGNHTRPYLMHNCNPTLKEIIIEKTWYEAADLADNNHCIYCKKPYPTEILTATKLLNGYMPTHFEP